MLKTVNASYKTLPQTSAREKGQDPVQQQPSKLWWNQEFISEQQTPKFKSWLTLLSFKVEDNITVTTIFEMFSYFEP